ncbi:hypothetical protein Tco_0061283, partial [Tanacetum coccineum]
MPISKGTTKDTNLTTHPRQKVNLLSEEIYKRSSCRRKSEDDGKLFHVILQEKSHRYKSKSLYRALFTIIIATIILMTYTIAIRQHEYVSHATSRRHLVKIWNQTRGPYIPYVSYSQIDWVDISKVANKIAYGKQVINGVGLLNFNEKEIFEWKTHIFPNSANNIVLNLDPVNKNVTWDSLYPEWIDEEQENEVPKCPIFPKLDVPENMFDVIAIKLPCRN